MIVFKEITFKNFLSFGNSPTTIYLNKRQKTLIVGKNGGGKSSLIDALSFALFGKAFRKINIPQIVNKINGKDCLVILTFQKNDKHYKIVRGLKPNIFEIYMNDVLIDQDSKKKDYQQYLEKNILCFGYKSFSQVVVLGSSSFIPFMKLTPADRRIIIEDLLEIDMFSKMNVLLKPMIQDLKSEQKEIRFDEDLCRDRIESQESFEKKVRQNRNKQITEIESEIKHLGKDVVKYKKDIEKMNMLVQKKLEKIPNISEAKQLQNKLQELQIKLSQSQNRVKTERDFFSNHVDCPTCKQPIQESFRNSSISSRNSKISEFDSALRKVSGALNKSQVKMEKIADMQSQVSKMQNEIQILNLNMDNLLKNIQNRTKAINDLRNETNLTEDSKEKLEHLRNQIVEIEKRKENCDHQSRMYKVALDLLKDSGIKTVIIKQYLPIINKLVYKYLSSLKFFVNFQLS